ncbi:UvrD-helicase domain-containing protein [Pseudomonas oligotrophica]|uniref:UvrD-helicase domain-containing protein n=1 Tax=Pseudomonas oligotrophica TaxID=2912055 RepID=UPI001F030247|nr:UvrD-helicase domain-containing protein [Pseudomonas oligotrophica]MCF7202521.1 UvrD-helicase domain-containing protein [Pseudomonas oligotrophica]
MIPFTDLVAPVTDEDIDWVCELMQLKPLDEARREFLKVRETRDVSACPGSGKTTLIVAKLALLARRWKSSTRGLCVLSHTNVAREEIQRRLGGTAVGQRLLQYPHYIDTIHGFVSRFLAKPWLHSAGIPLTAIDDDLTHSARRRALTLKEYRTLNNYLERSFTSLERLTLSSMDFSAPLDLETFPCGKDTRMYRLAASAVGSAAREGYFCYDDIFVIAQELLSRQPSVAATLQERFPCILLDEMQDTSRQQNQLLSQIFRRDNESICVVRVGDPNQAIFEHGDEAGDDSFPDSPRSIAIADSFRFDGSIASLACRFAYTPILPTGLQGKRASEAQAAPIPHTVFVFPDDDATGVLSAYGELVLQHVPSDVIASCAVSALGAVHKTIERDPQDKLSPRTVGHYWEPYVTAKHPTTHRPESLIDYFRTAKQRARLGNTMHAGLERIGAGLIHLANLQSPPVPLRAESRIHRQLDGMLSLTPRGLRIYRKLIDRLLCQDEQIDQAAWTSWVRFIDELGVLIGGGQRDQPDAMRFLEWHAAPVEDTESAGQLAPAFNHYRYHYQERHVDIKLGSIHVAKGETHAATLILDTYNRTHFLKALMPWLSGKYVNGGHCDNDGKRRRLMEMYVAMTRPSHLLCLAIRKSSLGNERKAQQHLEQLQAHGWTVHHLNRDDSLGS